VTFTLVAARLVTAATWLATAATWLVTAATWLVTAAAAAAPYDAAYVTESIPSFVELNAPVAVSVTMRNTGSATWLRAEGDVFLATQRPQDNYYWCIQDNPHGMYSGNRVLLPYDVAPGAEVTFAFFVKPLSCGFAADAPFRFRMLSQTYGTFGEETPDPGTTVSTAADFVSQQAPSIAPAGARIPVTVAFRNTTLAPWTPADGYALASAGPAGNTTWGTASVPLSTDVAPGAVATFSFVIDVPATPAKYNFQWQMSRGANAPFGAVSPATAIDVVTPGPANYQGLWWAAPAGSEAGWGIQLAHHDDTIFATWFTYDANGNALWLSMTAQRNVTGQFAGQYTGALVRTTGPAFDIAVFPPNQVRSVTVGSGALAFDDSGGGTFAYTLNGVSRTKSIVRQAFALLPTCTFALFDDPALAYNYQDLWWASPAGSQSGWGVSLAHQRDIVFATWFTYDHDGSPLWLSFTAPKQADGSYAGTLYRTTGPPASAQPFDPARVAATNVGTASLAFTDGNAGTFTWSFAGVTRSTPITRQIFVSPGTVCQ